ncbi:MAG: F0F1 ATP synthase subunit delta [Janthinobacterium lividum]
MAELATIARPYAEAAFNVAVSARPTAGAAGALAAGGPVAGIPVTASSVQAPVTAAAAGSATDTIGSWSVSLKELAQVASNPDVRLLEMDPNVGSDQFVDLLFSAVRAPLDEPVRNFVRMLVENHRASLLPQIAEQFETMKNTRAGSADALITSAFPLEGAALAELVAALEKKFGTRLQAHVVVDPSLIGGVSVAVGDEVLDTSVRARLAQMQAALTA